MASPITELAVTTMAVSPGDQFERFGKLSAPAYLWYRKTSKEAGLTAIKIVHGTESPGTEYSMLESELLSNYGITIWFSTIVEASPIVDLKVCTSDDHIQPGADFIKDSTVLNPNSPHAAPREYLFVKTQATQAKIENADYVAGDFVDVLDTHNQWLVGRVVSADGDFLNIHYEGWSDKWDERIPRQGRRVQPYRTKTQGKNTGWKGDQQAFNLCHDVQNFQAVESRFASVLAKVTTKAALDDEEDRFLQQDNAAYVSNVLSAVIDDPALIPRVQKYLQNNLLAIVTRMQSSVPVDLHSVELLFKIFNGMRDSSSDSYRFYRKYGILGDEPDPSGDFAFRRITAHQSADNNNNTSVHLTQNLNFFGKIGGFDAIGMQLALMPSGAAAAAAAAAAAHTLTPLPPPCCLTTAAGSSSSSRRRRRRRRRRVMHFRYCRSAYPASEAGAGRLSPILRQALLRAVGAARSAGEPCVADRGR